MDSSGSVPSRTGSRRTATEKAAAIMKEMEDKKQRQISSELLRRRSPSPHKGYLWGDSDGMYSRLEKRLLTTYFESHAPPYPDWYCGSYAHVFEKVVTPLAELMEDRLRHVMKNVSITITGEFLSGLASKVDERPLELVCFAEECEELCQKPISGEDGLWMRQCSLVAYICECFCSTEESDALYVTNLYRQNSLVLCGKIHIGSLSPLLFQLKVVNASACAKFGSGLDTKMVYDELAWGSLMQSFRQLNPLFALLYCTVRQWALQNELLIDSWEEEGNISCPQNVYLELSSRQWQCLVVHFLQSEGELPYLHGSDVEVGLRGAPFEWKYGDFVKYAVLTGPPRFPLKSLDTPGTLAALYMGFFEFLAARTVKCRRISIAYKHPKLAGDGFMFIEDPFDPDSNLLDGTKWTRECKEAVADKIVEKARLLLKHLKTDI